MKIYIAGKITGLDNYKELFNKAEKELLAKGYKVMNPSVLPKGFEWAEYMQICFKMIDACDEIYMLNNWEDSKGAKVEHYYVKQVRGMKVTYQEDQMELDRAMEILQDRVRADRGIRENKTESEFDKWAEEQCIAMETIIQEIYKQDKQISEMLGGM